MVEWVDRSNSNCSDAYSATDAASPGTPWCSFETALRKAPAASTTLVRAGTYPVGQMYVNDLQRNSPTTFESAASDTGEVTLQGKLTISNSRNITLRGLHLAAGSHIVLNVGDSDIALVDNNLEGSTTIRPCRNCSVIGNVIHDVPHVYGKSNDGWGLLINGSWSGDPTQAGIYGLRVLHNTFRNLENDAIQVTASVFDARIAGNRFENVVQLRDDAAHADCIQAWNLSGIVIERNLFDHCASGILTKDADTSGEVIADNVFRAGGGYGLTLYNTDAVVVNNTMLVSGDQGWHNGVHIDQQPGHRPTSVKLINNILTALATPDRSYLAQEDHNIFEMGSSGTGLHDLENTTPQFADPAGGDYELLDDSPGARAGAIDPDVPPTDYRGDPRPSDAPPDIGAYQRQPASG